MQRQKEDKMAKIITTILTLTTLIGSILAADHYLAKASDVRLI